MTSHKATLGLLLIILAVVLVYVNFPSSIGQAISVLTASGEAQLELTEAKQEYCTNILLDESVHILAQDRFITGDLPCQVSTLGVSASGHKYGTPRNYNDRDRQRILSILGGDYYLTDDELKVIAYDWMHNPSPWASPRQVDAHQWHNLQVELVDIEEPSFAELKQFIDADNDEWYGPEYVLPLFKELGKRIAVAESQNPDARKGYWNVGKTTNFYGNYYGGDIGRQQKFELLDYALQTDFFEYQDFIPYAVYTPWGPNDYGIDHPSGFKTKTELMNALRGFYLGNFKDALLMAEKVSERTQRKITVYPMFSFGIKNLKSSHNNECVDPQFFREILNMHRAEFGDDFSEYGYWIRGVDEDFQDYALSAMYENCAEGISVSSMIKGIYS